EAIGRYCRRPLGSAPHVYHGNLVDAGNCAVRSAGFFRPVFTPDIVGAVLLQRNRRIAALLRAVMHQAVLADVQVASPRPASPVVGPTLSDVVLKVINAAEAALLQVFHGMVHLALLLVQRL